MSRFLTAIGTLGLGLILGAGAAHVSTAQNVLAPDQLRLAATTELRIGAPARALAYAKALTDRDPADLTAWLVQGKAHRSLGDYGAARDAAGKAWALAETDDQRYASALIMAQALSSDGKRTRAQLWLRRAGHHAPTPAAEARARDHFRYVQSRNPWRTDFTFSLAPTSNINNGSAKDRSRLDYRVSELLFGEAVDYQLAGSAQALSGLEYGAGVTTRYRFAETFKTAHDAYVRANYRSYVLSDSARSAAPTVRGSDFSYGTFELGWQYRRLVLEGQGEDKLEAALGQSWYGGSRYASHLNVGLSRTVAVGPRALLHLSGQVREEIGQTTTDRRTFNLQAGVTRRLQGGASLHLSTGVATTISPQAEAEYDELRLRTAYAPKAALMGASLEYGLTVRWRDYDVSRHDPDGRSDLSVFGDVTATFREIDYYGFNPAVTVRSNFTDSNINLFDVNQLAVGFGIRSEF